MANRLPPFVLAGLLAAAFQAQIASGESDKSTIAAPSRWAEIRVIDSRTGRGVPLVELETVHGMRFVTDNAGRIAFAEPGLLEREVYFSVRSHGYEVDKDGFGFSGARVTPRVGAPAVIRIHRRMLAERLCRLTGEGLERDSLLLGHPPLRPESPHPGGVAGQDSVQAAIYRDRVYCIWGDTQRMEYPLGLFRAAGATLPLPDPRSDLAAYEHGFAYDYFVDEQSGLARAMMPLTERPEGVVWVFALAVVPDDRGVDRLVAHYSRRKGLDVELEQGVAVFNDSSQTFEPAAETPLTETWRKPAGHPILFEEDGTRWLLYGSPTPNVRVPAALSAVLDAAQYEAFTCARRSPDGAALEPDLLPDGRPHWRWQRELPPMDSKTERDWVLAGRLPAEHARFCPSDAASPRDRIQLHSGSVRWNEYRRRWLLIAGEFGGSTSLLGEVWCAEAVHPTGPFRAAVKIATHDRMSFYNVCHHAFFDVADGRFIHFEGTYTNDFSGVAEKTPRYNYNQVLYRLDLDDPGLAPIREEKGLNPGEPAAHRPDGGA